MISGLSQLIRWVTGIPINAELEDLPKSGEERLILHEVSEQAYHSEAGSFGTSLDNPVKASSSRERLLIFVIAYYAESTLRRVLERIPSSTFQQYDCEVLVVDDASEDRAFAIGREYKAHHPEIKMTVLRNEYNQGYRGNQKVGYTYAISEGFDFVAMLRDR